MNENEGTSYDRDTSSLDGTKGGTFILQLSLQLIHHTVTSLLLEESLPQIQHETMETPGTQSKAIVNLECGTSLAELEYASEHQQNERKSEEKKDEECTQSAPSSSTESMSTCEEMIQSIRNNLANDIVTNGNIQMFTSPYETPEAHKATGQTAIPEKERYVSLPLVYCDQTASNRSLKSVENYIRDVCLPLYGNTHTNTSVTGSQSTAFVAEARQIVAEGCNAKITGKAALDVVLFAGNGATSVVELLIDCIGIKHYALDEKTRPVVFVGPYEHHSNLLPWRESGCEIVMIPECVETGNVDVDHLERMLQSSKYGKDRLRMGAFTAASNVTGKVCDVDKISATLHKYGALSFLDYATGAAYLPINMNPFPTGNYTAADVSKDAIFISPHKMVGGAQTPGVLVVKKHLVNQTIAPKRSGGGTVFYVTHKHHRFLSNRIERFEGGTPNICGILRAGLTFLVKRRIANQYLQALNRRKKEDTDSIPHNLLDYEFNTHKTVVERLKKTAPNIIVLGAANDKDENNHLPIFSFLIKCGDRFLHYNYVCAILNDLFGIQSRGGCQCAGPYSQRLLGLTKVEGLEEIPNEINDRIEHALLHYKERAELLRPGFSRLSLPFKGLHHDEVEYVIKALEWVAKNGWVFISQYRCNHRTGEWRHFSRQGKPLGRSERRWLSHFDTNYSSDNAKVLDSEPLSVVLGNAFDNANYQLTVSRNDHTIAQALKMTDKNEILDNDDLDLLRWYVYPRECALLLKKGEEPDTISNKISGGIRPIGYFEPATYKFSSSLLGIEDFEKQTSAMAIVNDDTVEQGDIECNGEVRFKDGEHHSGVAHIEDIIEGHDDGELSDECVIYVEKEDEWIPIIEFLKRRKTTAASSTKTDEPEDMQIDAIAPPVDVDMTPVRKPQIEEKDVSRGKKKPSRDSSAWGKTAAAQIPLPKAAPVESVSSSNGEIPKKSIEKNVESCPNPHPQNKSNKRKKTKHIKPPAKLMRYITQAIMQWDMIQEGDRLLLGLSGGKDSLSLLHCLLEFQRKLPTKFEIEVCTIDPMTPSFDPSPLIPYVESLGLKYHYIRDNIVERANTAGTNGQVVKSLCAFCARMKRGNLYATARKNNCNKLVLAQHLDDCAESFLMSAMHNGFIRSKFFNFT